MESRTGSNSSGGDSATWKVDDFRRFSFPVKLFAMIMSCHENGLTSVLSWQSHGKCFKVHDRHLFVQWVLPVWFRMKEYESFVRQLSFYGFERIPSGPDQGYYYHPLFYRPSRPMSHFNGIPTSVYMIRRQKIKGKGPRKPGSSKLIPDFWGDSALANSSQPNAPCPVGSSQAPVLVTGHERPRQNQGPFQANLVTAGDGIQSTNEEDSSASDRTEASKRELSVMAESLGLDVRELEPTPFSLMKQREAPQQNQVTFRANPVTNELSAMTHSVELDARELEPIPLSLMKQGFLF